MREYIFVNNQLYEYFYTFKNTFAMIHFFLEIFQNINRSPRMWADLRFHLAEIRQLRLLNSWVTPIAITLEKSTCNMLSDLQRIQISKMYQWFFFLCVVLLNQPHQQLYKWTCLLNCQTVFPFLSGRKKAFEFQVYIIKAMQITIKLANNKIFHDKKVS